MRNYDEESYRRYKQYRVNKYRYEQEQVFFPLSIVLIGVVLMAIWQYILIAVISIAVAVLLFLFLRKRSSEQMRAEQPLIISSEEAQSGVEIDVTINNIEKPITIKLQIPPKTENGQKIIVKNVMIQSNSGEKKKVDICFEIKINE